MGFYEERLEILASIYQGKNMTCSNKYNLPISNIGNFIYTKTDQAWDQYMSRSIQKWTK